MNPFFQIMSRSDQPIKMIVSKYAVVQTEKPF